MREHERETTVYEGAPLGSNIKEQGEESWNNDMVASIADLGCFIQPSRCM